MKYWIFSFAAAALLGASHCLCSSLPWLCRGCRRRRNLSSPCPASPSAAGAGGERQAAPADLAHRHFDICCLARARIRCLPQPPRFAEPGSLFATNFEHSWAWVCCMYISPSHSAGLLFPPWLVERNTPRNLCGSGCMCGFSRVCCPWSTAVLCVTWPVLTRAELCLAEKGSSEEMHGLSCSGNEAGCLRWVLIVRGLIFILPLSFLYLHTVLLLSLTYASI